MDGAVFLISITLVVFFVLCIIVYITLRFACHPKRDGVFARHGDKIVASCAAVSVALGTAAALGGAIATVQTANLGLELARASDAREDMKFLEERSIKASSLYSSVLEETSQLYSSVVYFEAGVPDGFRNGLTDDEKEKLSHRSREIIKHLLGMASGLRAIARDQFSATCFTKNWERHDNRLMTIGQKLGSFEANGGSVPIIPDSLTDVADILDKAANDVMGEVGNLILISKIIGRNEIGQRQNFRLYGGRDFDFFINLSNVISYEVGSHISILYGGAIVRDIIFSSPNGEDITNCLQKEYGSPQFDIAKVRRITAFEPRTIVGKHLMSTIEQFDVSVDNYMITR